MTQTLSAPTTATSDLPLDDPARRIDLGRMRHPVTGAALIALAIASLGQALGTMVAGRLAEGPSGHLVLLLAICVVGGATLDTAGRIAWAGVVDRAEGALRGDLLDAALHQPLGELTEQAVGEILDRVDDDTHEVGTLLRMQAWMAMRTAFGVLPMWVVAGLSWWPAWVLFPVVAVTVLVVIRPLMLEISRRKVIEEAAWTDHAAVLEEGIAGRDDLRTSLGQPFAVRRLAQLSAIVHARFRDVITVEAKLATRTGLLLNALLIVIAISGVVLVGGGHLEVGRLVTLFLVTTAFVGQINTLAHQLPDIQAGVGAVIRLRQMMAVPEEPRGGAAVPDGTLDLEIRDLDFSYAEGTFGLRDIDLRVAAGHTIALVGRTGSGKSTLASLLSRAVEPPTGTVFLGGVDVTTLDLHALRATVGVVTQRTELLAGTLAENITLFAPTPRTEVEAAVAELGLTEWVGGLPDGLDTLLGPGGTSLSAGEEQLVAFARLLVRDVQVVVLDEATARMDPLTESRVVAAADRLLTRRTGVLVAHRLSTIERADMVAVLDHGRVIQQGMRDALALVDGPFRRLLDASDTEAYAPDGVTAVAASGTAPAAPEAVRAGQNAVGGRRRIGDPPKRPPVASGLSLARGTWRAMIVTPWWGLFSVLEFLGSTVLAPLGALTGFAWGRVVQSLREGGTPSGFTALLVAMLLVSPFIFADALRRYPRWWVEVLLRVRMAVLAGQIRPQRLPRTPPGEVVARSMDADRLARYSDRWVDFVNGLLIALITTIAGASWLAGGILLAVMAASALASSIGRPIAGRSASRSSAARARFGRAVVSAVESARTVKLAGRTPEVHAHLQEVDAGRVEAAVFEHRIQALLDGIPTVLVQAGVVAAWACYLGDVWGLATALLVANAVNGFDWFGRVAGAVVTEAPGVAAWQRATSRFAGGADLMQLPRGVDLLSGTAPDPDPPSREPLRRLELSGLTVVHDDGTLGVSGVELSVERGELVLLLGQVGSGKSSLLAALAGLLSHHGSIAWNDRDVTDPETFLRPGQVAHIAQVPRVLSGTFRDNVALGFDREVERPIRDARLSQDVDEAGGPDAMVGHRGVRLSGGQVQRLALARALAADTELLLADDVSSALDAATEVELWQALRQRQTTVIGATSKRAALAQADRVVVLVDGQIAAIGPWRDLADDWSHLAG